MKKFVTILSMLMISMTAFGNADEMTEQCRDAIIDFKCYGDVVRRYETNTCNVLSLIGKNLRSQAKINLSFEDMDFTSRRLGRDRPSRNHGVFYSQNGAACAEAIAKSIKEFASNSYQEKFREAPRSTLYLETLPLSEAYSGFLTRVVFPKSAKESAERYAKSMNKNGPYIVIYWSKNQFLNSYY